jgi:histidinol-phosphate aminotransferase
MHTVGAQTEISLEFSHNPFSPVDTVALLGFDVRPYPAPGAPELTATIARHSGLTPAEVLVANGSDEILLLLALGVARPDAIGAVPDISFTGYKYALDAVGMAVRTFRTDPHRGLDLDAALDATDGAAVCYLPNPHNPLGTVCPPADLVRFLDATEGRGCVVVVDEAYIEFVPAFAGRSVLRSVRDHPHLAVVRSLSKSHGLAGVRCGYVASHPDLISRLAQVKKALPFSVNAITQAIVPDVLADRSGLERSVASVRTSLAALSGGLRASGFDVLDSYAAFITVDVRPASSHDVAARLAASGIRVRDTADMGLPGYIRLGSCDLDLTRRVVDEVVATCTSLAEGKIRVR